MIGGTNFLVLSRRERRNGQVVLNATERTLTGVARMAGA